MKTERDLGEKEKTFTYSDLKNLKVEEIESGTVITGVKPRDLYTTQNWISERKAIKALNSYYPQDKYPTAGYIKECQDGRKILILGDGNTKALVAWEREEKVTFTLKGKLPDQTKYHPLSRLRNSFRDWFKNFDYS